ncbi:MAG TPA: hypothetical protein VKB79_08890 [Bryobacteraceae bacterium]|nr:hypothetical protein [Bryobacteraceae bacterium]
MNFQRKSVGKQGLNEGIQIRCRRRGFRLNIVQVAVDPFRPAEDLKILNLIGALDERAKGDCGSRKTPAGPPTGFRVRLRTGLDRRNLERLLTFYYRSVKDAGKREGEREPHGRWTQTASVC